MDARFYNSEEIDIERLAGDLMNIYLAQGYQAQQIGNKDQMMVQLKKGGDFEAIIGMQAALSVTIQRTAGGVLAMIGQQKWLDKAAVGAVGVVAMPVLWPLMLTAGVGAVRQASLSNQVLNVVDGLVRQQRPGLQAGQIPMQLLPQVQQMWSPPPPSYTPPYVPGPQVVNALPAPAPVPVAPPAGKLRCPNCNTPYEEGDTFCTGCGKSLKLLCPNCKAELLFLLRRRHIRRLHRVRRSRKRRSTRRLRSHSHRRDRRRLRTRRLRSQRGHRPHKRSSHMCRQRRSSRRRSQRQPSPISLPRQSRSRRSRSHSASRRRCTFRPSTRSRSRQRPRRLPNRLRLPHPRRPRRPHQQSPFRRGPSASHCRTSIRPGAA